MSFRFRLTRVLTYCLLLFLCADAPVFLEQYFPVERFVNKHNAEVDESLLIAEIFSTDNYRYSWRQDQPEIFGEADIVQPGKSPSYSISPKHAIQKITVVDKTPLATLMRLYRVELSGPDWTRSHARLILEALQSIPHEKDAFRSGEKPQRWFLTSDFIQDDIQIEHDDGVQLIKVSMAAFTNASSRAVDMNQRRYRVYSKRLHHALVRLITDNGHNEYAYEKILQERFGVTTRIPRYEKLTALTTKETAGRFQKFHSEEIIQLINMFEEMPANMHKLSQLKYLVRRLDGTPHPLYAEAPAVAWTSSAYIEFMETAFNGSFVDHMQRLIIHEKSHFLWSELVSPSLKKEWASIGGWYRDIAAKSAWSTSDEIAFVSVYAHAKNPEEDMAESISFYITNPLALKSRAPNKFNFIRDNIMDGDITMVQIRADLQTEVVNLSPDFVNPGKIKAFAINIDGGAEDKKKVTIELELQALDELLEGGSLAYMRVVSEVGTFTDLYLHPVDEAGNKTGKDKSSALLRGSFTLSEYAKSGYWQIPQIVIEDAVGNRRMVDTKAYAWQVYVNNPLEDLSPPTYVAGSARLTKTFAVREGREVQIIHATWQVDENTFMRPRNACYASINDDVPDRYRIEEYGSYNAKTKRCLVEFIMPHYMPSSIYTMNHIITFDQALNSNSEYFVAANDEDSDQNSSTGELPQEIELLTKNPDVEPPKLDLNDIQITTKILNSTTKNGETAVTVTFKVKDNISGYKIASLYLRDPKGVDHQYYVSQSASSRFFGQGNPKQWHRFSRNVILPSGSAPGMWGLTEMTIFDRAGNVSAYDFTEIVHFDISN